MQRTRKSQMEILGLAFVFIILIFGLIIFLRLNTNIPEQKSKYIDNQLAASIISSMLKTSVNCTQFHTYSVTDLLKDCVSTGRISCTQGSSCEVSNYTIFFMLNEKMIRQSRSFYFNVNDTIANNEIIIKSSSCNPKSQGIYYRQPFDVGGHTVNINLRICDFS